MFDTKTKKIKKLPQIPQIQRKLLSFATQENLNQVFVTCAHSNYLICLEGSSGKVKYFVSGIELGLGAIQGVCSLPDGNMAISDNHRGIVIYNTRTRKTSQRFDLPLHMSTHLTWIA